MYGYIYMFTNLLNNKRYIGKHKYHKPELDKNYLTSGKIITESIKKHGLDNFKQEIIDIADSLEELNEKESYYIREFKTRHPDGYNLTDGGDGAPNLDEDSRKKLAYWAGKKQSDESKEKRRESLKKVKRTPEWLAKMSASNKKHKPSDLTRLRSSERHKGSHWCNNGSIEIMLECAREIPEGYKLGRLKSNKPKKKLGPKNPETIKKISDKKRGSKWYNNGIYEQMIHPEDIIPDGFIPGRIKKLMK